jgi:hypothetical protein
MTNERRHEADPQRADFRDRVAPHSARYVSGRIAAAAAGRPQ